MRVSRNSGVAAATRTLVFALSALVAAGAAAAQDGGAPNALIIGALRPTAAPVFSPAAAPDQDLVNVAVTYAFTGVLRDEVKAGGRLHFGPGPKPLAAGTPVFGMPTNLPSGLAPNPNLTWCAVSPPEKPQGPQNVTCFPRLRILLTHATEVAFIPLGPDLFPARFAILRDHDLAKPEPDIEARPIDLAPPLKVSVQFAGWDNNLANLRVIVRQPAYTSPFTLVGNNYVVLANQVVGRLHLPRDASGAAHLPLFGGEILIRPGPDGKSAVAELARPFGR
ncbi:MAG TPA: hypothetical protein VGH15_12525 [Caulobacteraceae bacterium]|jgi:hypothetical protein